MSMPGIPARGLKSAALLGAARAHGDRLRYQAGCKCFRCRRANSDYERARGLARAEGDWNGVVEAAAARAHIVELSRLGVGQRQIWIAAGVARSSIAKIRAGTKTRIRQRTERRILAVGIKDRADRVLVPAAQSWRLIRLMLAEGFTAAELARRLGYAHRGLQFRRTRVTLRTAHRIGVLYRQVTT